MSQRLYVAIKFEVEYSTGISSFSNDEDFFNLITTFGADHDYVGNGGEYSSESEVSVTSYESAIRKAKEYKDAKQRDEEIDRALDRMAMNIDEAIELMERFYDHAAKRDGFLHFSFF